MQLHGQWIDEGSGKQAGDLYAWGEWEPESAVVSAPILRTVTSFIHGGCGARTTFRAGAALRASHYRRRIVAASRRVHLAACGGSRRGRRRTQWGAAGLRKRELLQIVLVAGLDVDPQRPEDADDGVVVGDDDRQLDQEFGVQVTA